MKKTNQSFNVDDIRRIREQAHLEYQSMTLEEISQEIKKNAAEGYKILEQVKKNKVKQIKVEENTTRI